MPLRADRAQSDPRNEANVQLRQKARVFILSVAKDGVVGV